MVRATVSSLVTCEISVLDEAVFRETIARERTRTERSGRSMILLLVSIPDVEGDAYQAALVACAKVFGDLRSDIDKVGWVVVGRTVGLLIPEVDPADASALCERLTAECTDGIVRAIGRESCDRLSIASRLYPEQHLTRESDVFDLMDPIIYPDLVAEQRQDGRLHTVKRGMDIVLSVLLLAILSPLFLACAVLVKCSSPGPICFRQVRVGHMMKPFVIYKFRTMYEDADHQVHQDYVSWFITESNQTRTEEDPTVFKLTKDRRITPVGRVLRMTSLDELPQIWNVLRGEMSLVGPRPPLPYEVLQYKPWHRGRLLEAKPGITGLWQVVGRSRTTFDEMVRLDLQYARTMSVWLDLKIILATPGAMISGKGAH